MKNRHSHRRDLLGRDAAICKPGDEDANLIVIERAAVTLLANDIGDQHDQAKPRNGSSSARCNQFSAG